MIPATISSQYDSDYPYLKRLEQHVKDFLQPYCEKYSFLFEGRIKSKESLIEKLETGRYSSWRDIDDMYACTIVINLASDEIEVLRYLHSIFEKNENKTKYRGSQVKAYDVFRYDSTRSIFQLKKPHHIEQNTPLYDLYFEVQIRTLFDYAWAKTTHALSYKSPVVDWKRMRLAAQLKAATEQIELLIVAFDSASEFVDKSQSPDLSDQATIHIFFDSLFKNKVLPEELEPLSWNRFSNNVYKLFQLLNGKKPSGRSNFPLKKILDYLEKVEIKIRLDKEGGNIPRSLTLFQYIACILLEEVPRPPENREYFFVVTEELRTLYPNVLVPWDKFKHMKKQELDRLTESHT